MNLVVYTLDLRRNTLVTRVYLCYHARFPSTSCKIFVHKSQGVYIVYIVVWQIWIFNFLVFVIRISHLDTFSVTLQLLFYISSTLRSRPNWELLFLLAPISQSVLLDYIFHSFFCAVISNMYDIFSRYILPTAMILYLKWTQLSTLVSLVILGWESYSDKHCMNIRVLSMC